MNECHAILGTCNIFKVIIIICTPIAYIKVMKYFFFYIFSYFKNSYHKHYLVCFQCYISNKFLCYFVLNDCVIAQNILFVILILMHSPIIISTIMLHESFRLSYPPTVSSYFHHSLEKEQPGKECVHIMKKVSIEFRLAPILL